MADFLIHLLKISPTWEWLAYAAAALVHVTLVLTVVMVSDAVFIWMERKIAGRIQDRLGPTRVGGRFGWLQSPADGLKLLCKEDIIPAGADRLLFRLAPYISFAAPFTVLLAIPMANGWVSLQLDSAAFFVLAVAGLEVFGVILGGYASASKWSLYGAMREAAQVVSYEIPLGLCVVLPVLLAGSMDLVAIGNAQAGWVGNWFVFHDPFTFCTFWIYLACATAGVNRAPFDLPEAESELVAGFMTEYSGFRWAMFMMAEYTAMFVVSSLAAVLFLGGWNGPIPVAALLGLATSKYAALVWFANLLGCTNFLVKVYVGVIFMMWLRWTLPRLRIDQVMATCLRYCVPLVSVMLVGAAAWTFSFPGGVMGEFFTTKAAPNVRATSSVRVGWVAGTGRSLVVEPHHNPRETAGGARFARPTLPPGSSAGPSARSAWPRPTNESSRSEGGTR